MSSRLRTALVLSAGLVATSLVPSISASATTALRVTSTVTPSLSATMPVLRLHFSTPVSARTLPALTVRPALATTWQQIGANEVQAVVRGTVQPLIEYRVWAPTQVSCASKCRFTAQRSVITSASANALWEEQLLATLHYLPLTFTPLVAGGDPAALTAGTFTWAYAHLPASLSAQWQTGADNVILKGALMAFQSDHQLATSGVADPTTWGNLISAVEQHQVDANGYNYVDVSEHLPEMLTLYVGGVVKFHALVNTGVPGATTQIGTYPVYLRYVHQIMSGTNLDGSHYADPVSWVSYFYTGDALHQFPRYHYGWPQSLGCVEMALSDAQHVWPFTPIGTLVTVHA